MPAPTRAVRLPHLLRLPSQLLRQAWQRSLLTRVVTATLLASVLLVVVVGVGLVSQVGRGLVEAQRQAVGKDGADAGCRGDLVEQAAQPGAARLRIGLRPEQRRGGLARHWRGARTQEDQEA